MNRIALLIPHYNDAEGLYASLASIDPGEQADVFVVDDGSQRIHIDEPQARAAFRAQGCLSFIYLPQNLGIDGALNAGLAQIHQRGYTYVARLDCNNRHIGQRLRIQAEFLDAHPEVCLLGTAADYFRGDKVCFTVRHPQSHEAIRRAMQKDSAFIHSSVMFRVSLVDEIGLYPVAFPAAEDFEYFWRMLERHRVANLPQVLIRNEYNDGGISMTRRRRQQTSRLRILLRHYDFSPHATFCLLFPLLSLTLLLGFVRALKRAAGIRAWS
jgi:glycosyltransferase involved in cell wall biosynthesis